MEDESLVTGRLWIDKYLHYDISPHLDEETEEQIFIRFDEICTDPLYLDETLTSRYDKPIEIIIGSFSEAVCNYASKRRSTLVGTERVWTILVENQEKDAYAFFDSEADLRRFFKFAENLEVHDS